MGKALGVVELVGGILSQWTPYWKAERETEKLCRTTW